MRIGVIGAGAFGTALAVALARDGRDVSLWARDPNAIAVMRTTRRAPRLPDVDLPTNIVVTDNLREALSPDILLLAMPAQALRGFLLEQAPSLVGRWLVACCKGIDIETMSGPSRTLADLAPDSVGAVMTGPSFAADIAAGLPTALTLASADEHVGIQLQATLSTETLRLYRTTDMIGADLGGALKNVMAIACGACIGAGLGESARAALMTRGFAEMQRFALAFGARPETLMGLSGLGDLALTCSSEMSRNFRYGRDLARGVDFAEDVTVEGAKTAVAVARIAKLHDLDLPISSIVAKLVSRDLTVAQAMKSLLSRPLKEE
jgi:glycerol-3-phosphate dehydrogenase (NAD(P)+)